MKHNAKKTLALLLALVMVLSLVPAMGIAAYADDTSYTLTIPSTLTVANSGWNATDGISATGALESGKVLTVTASSANSWALKDGENSVGYNLSTESGTYNSSATPASWEFTAAEVAASGGTNKGMGINVEDYSTKPAGTYQDTVTFTAAVNYPSVTVPARSFTRSVFENDVIDPDEARYFRQGDTVAVTAAGQNPAVYECNNAEDQTWTLKQGEQLRWTADPLNFQAYSPATEGTSMTTFTMPTDQSTLEKLNAADYMTRGQYISKPDGDTDIHMQLERKMSKVIVHVKGFSGAFTDDEKYIRDGSMRIYSQAEKLENNNPSGDSTEVKPYIQKANSADNGYKVGSTFTAHVIPGYGVDYEDFLQFSNSDWNTLNVRGIPEFEAGKAYEYDLGVGKQGAVLMDHHNNPTPIQSITLQDQTVTIGGEWFVLEPTISPSNATCKALEWFIPNASYNSFGYLETADSYMINDRAAMYTRDYYEGQPYGAKPGTYKVYAYALDGSGAVGECNVTVLPKYVTDITLNKTETTISAGNKETLSVSSVAPNDATYKTVTWSSDNTDVATVNATTGEVTGVAAGTATITAMATDGGGATETCTVTVSASTPLNNTTTAWTAGTFAVPAGGLTYSDAITVSGDVTLVLTDGTTLTLNKGISLASGATLTVQGNGTMNVNGTNNSTASTVAGSGTIILTSGTLTAKGGNGAGISGWDDGQTESAGGVAINGAVTVSGGTLTATGGNGGSIDSNGCDNYAGVGGAAISGSVTVNGGTVTSTGGNGGNLKVTISGGTDNERAGNGGAAIGGDATITSGTWTATNGSNGTYNVTSGCYGCSAGTGGKAVAGTVTDNR